MSENRNTTPFWRNVATGLGVAAAGAVFAYLLNEVINSPEELPHEERRSREEGRNSERRRRNSSFSDRRGSTELRTNIADKLNSGTYECNICLDEITSLSRIYACKNCYTIYHLVCLRQHVSQSRDAGKPPDCPTCRTWIPYNLQYHCFCGKQANPSPVSSPLIPTI